MVWSKSLWGIFDLKAQSKGDDLIKLVAGKRVTRQAEVVTPILLVNHGNIATWAQKESLVGFTLVFESCGAGGYRETSLLVSRRRTGTLRLKQGVAVATYFSR